MLVGSDTSSYITTSYSKQFAEAETIEFWVRAYTPLLLANTGFILINQDNHFSFALVAGASYSAVTMKFTVNAATPVSVSGSISSTQLSGWIYVAGVIGLNEIKSYLITDETDPVVAASLISVLPSYSSKSLIFNAAPITTPAAKFVGGLREFRIWGKYKTPGELRGQRFVRPAVHAPGLYFYLPMDESSGAAVVERVSQTSIAVDSNYWYDRTDDLVTAYGDSSQESRGNVALAVQDKGGIRFNVSSGSYTYNELTFVLWIRLTSGAQVQLQWLGYYIMSMKIDLTVSTTTTIQYADYKTSLRSSPVPANAWNSVAFVRGVSSRKVYVNGVSKTFDDSEVRGSAR